MSDIWNPWHGCKKVSEGCRNCYMYSLDKRRDRNGSDIYKVKGNFDLPIQRDRKGEFYIPSGSTIRVCMTSDFFLKEADCWRDEVWSMIKKRSDVFFYLLTKRIERVSECLPSDWGDGWENVWLNVSVENQRAADRRIPQLLALPFKHKGLMAAPLIGEVRLDDYLKTGKLAHVIVGGENYEGARPCHYEWVEKLYRSCVQHNVNFEFIETGNHFVKDGKSYTVPKHLQAEQAKKAGFTYRGRAVEVRLTEVAAGESLPLFETGERSLCDHCSYKKFCNPMGEKESCMLVI